MLFPLPCASFLSARDSLRTAQGACVRVVLSFYGSDFMFSPTPQGLMSMSVRPTGPVLQPGPPEQSCCPLTPDLSQERYGTWAPPAAVGPMCVVPQCASLSLLNSRVLIMLFYLSSSHSKLPSFAPPLGCYFLVEPSLTPVPPCAPLVQCSAHPPVAISFQNQLFTGPSLLPGGLKPF